MPSNRGPALSPHDVIAKLWPSFTARECEIAGLLVEGRSITTIARQLFLTPGTVKFHIGNLLRKAGARHTRELLALVISDLLARTALIEEGPPPAPDRSPARLARPPPVGMGRALPLGAQPENTD